MTRVRTATGLAPVRHRNAWIACGVLVQLIAAAIPATWIVVRAKHEAAGGLALRTTVLTASHELVRSPTAALIIAGSAVLFAVGSVLVARPFVGSLGMLVVAIPLAAVAGALVLGAIALVVALVVLLAGASGDLPDSSGGGGGSGANRKKSNDGKR